MQSTLVNRIILVGSFIGFLFQSSQVSIQYFKFETRKVISFLSESVQEPVATSVCFDIPDILDWDRVRHETGKKKIEELNFTLEQLFRYARDRSELLKHVSYRDASGRFRMDIGNKWNDRMKISRFYTQGLVCYLINADFEYSFAPEVARLDSSSYNYQLMHFVFDPVIRPNRILVTLSVYDHPYISRQFSSYAYMEMGNVIECFKISEEVKLLPSPWDTNCADPSRTSELNSFDCRKDCMIKAMQVTGYLPSTVILNHPLPVRLMPLIPDEKLANYSQSMQNECRKNCTSRFTPCIMFHSVTYTEVMKKSNESLELIVRTSKQPSKMTEAVRGMSFIDFFSFLCSCFGTWFGISFLSLQSFILWLGKRSQAERDKVTPFADTSTTQFT